MTGDAVHLLEDFAAFGGGLFRELEGGAGGGFFGDAADVEVGDDV